MVFVPQVKNCSSLEEYSTCGNRCLESCASKAGPGRTCGTVCERGCFCKQGLARNGTGDCILTKACLSKSTIGLQVYSKYFNN